MAMVQYGLWPNCTNDCDFCLLLDKKYKTVQERLNILNSVIHNIDVVDWQDKFSNGISLLGGEIFYTESLEVKAKFLELIDSIIDKILKPVPSAIFSVVSNGIYDPEVLLIPVIKKLDKQGVLDKFNLNFSWDLKYRFKSDHSLKQMIKNTNLVYDNFKITPIVQTCLTQYLIDAHLTNEFNIFDYQKINFPHTILAFLYPHKINTGKEVPDFFFKRNSLIKFIRWLKNNNHNDIVENFYNSVINSSQFKYTGLWDREPIVKGDNSTKYIEQVPTLEKKQILADCGHSNLYRCYADSDRCMLCDLNMVI